MGTETMGDRLLLVETPEFETTPEKMLDVLGRIVADRGLGMVFFRDYFLMDVELLGGGGRAAIEREMAKRGMKPLLPTPGAVPFQRLALEDRPDQGNRPGAAGGCHCGLSSPPITRRPKLLGRPRLENQAHAKGDDADRDADPQRRVKPCRRALPDNRSGPSESE